MEGKSGDAGDSKFAEDELSESKYGDGEGKFSDTVSVSSTSTSASTMHGGPKASSTSTMYITSTISVPNNDEIILSVSTVLRCQMLSVSIKMYPRIQPYIFSSSHLSLFFHRSCINIP